MKDENISLKVLKKIKDKKIKPKSRWSFLMKNYVIWALGFSSLVVGGLAFSSIIYMAKHNDWDAFVHTGKSFFTFIFITLPYFWMILLVMFIFVAYYNLKHTKKGYRYPLSLVVGLVVLSSFFLGGSFYVLGAGAALDDMLSKRGSFYPRFVNPKIEKFWNNPKKGRIMGIISSVNSSTEFEILNHRGVTWLILFDQDDVMPGAYIEIGKGARVIGREIEEGKIEAEKIFMMKAPGRKLFDNPELIKQKIRRMPKHFYEIGLGSEIIKRIEDYPEIKLRLRQKIIENKEIFRELIKNDPEIRKIFKEN